MSNPTPPSPLESNGPDRFNSHAGCSRHQAGVRTGIKDYCCCCDPCNYFRKDETTSRPSERLCCRCFPRIIVLKYTATNGDPCCRNLSIPMPAGLYDDHSVNPQSVIRYSGTIFGHTVTIYISNRFVDDGTGASYDTSGIIGCRWTIRSVTMGIDSEFAIDHSIVTCLGVPSLSVNHIAGLNGCVGTLSLLNFETAKVPFQHRDFPESFPDGEELSIPLPPEYTCTGCPEIPRFICRTLLDHNTGVPNWAEFEWDVNYIPNLNYDTGETIVGQWVYDPPLLADLPIRIYLVQDATGDCWLHTNFVQPEGLVSVEEYARIPLTSCGCTFKYLNVRPIIDPSYGTGPDYIGMDLRAGRCGCWAFVCGTRRCVPRWFCGSVFIDTIFYRDILFSWDVVSKCWLSSGGIDIDGNAMPSGLSFSICLEPDGQGGCQLNTSYLDYILTPLSIDSDSVLISGTIDGTNYSEDGYFNLSFSTSFDGDCNSIITCNQASPCAENCGSHPSVLYATMHGWSDYTDIPPPPITGECTTIIPLIFYHQVFPGTGSQILVTCSYTGYSIVNGTLNDEFGVAHPAKFLLTLKIDLGRLILTRAPLSNLLNVQLSETMVFDTEACGPYHATYAAAASLRSCFFVDDVVLFHHYTLDVVE